MSVGNTPREQVREPGVDNHTMYHRLMTHRSKACYTLKNAWTTSSFKISMQFFVKIYGGGGKLDIAWTPLIPSFRLSYFILDFCADIHKFWCCLIWKYRLPTALPTHLLSSGLSILYCKFENLTGSCVN